MKVTVSDTNIPAERPYRYMIDCSHEHVDLDGMCFLCGVALERWPKKPKPDNAKDLL